MTGVLNKGAGWLWEVAALFTTAEFYAQHPRSTRQPPLQVTPDIMQYAGNLVFLFLKQRILLDETMHRLVPTILQELEQPIALILSTPAATSSLPNSPFKQIVKAATAASRRGGVGPSVSLAPAPVLQVRDQNANTHQHATA